MSAELLAVEDVSIRLGDATILDGVSLSVDAGEFVGLVGPNGAGKTTLVRAINGVLDPDSGTVRIEGHSQNDCSAREWSRRVATVPQDTSVSFAFRVEDIVEMGRTPHRRRTQFGESGSDRERIEDALDRTDTTDFRDRSIDELSGGERQRVFVARALAQDTPLLLLDEPTASLDINHQVEILSLVRDLVADGRGAVAAIHDLDLAAQFCDRLALLHDGRIQAVGSPESVLESDVLDPAFETSTVVSTDLVTGTPRVTARSRSADGDGRRVHVLGGGRLGARAIAMLEDAGHDVTAGVLRDGDIAAETARSLDVPVVTTPPTGQTTPGSIASAHDLAADVDVAVLADVTVGDRQWTLDLAESAPAAVLLEERPLGARLHAGERAQTRYEALRERGKVVELGNIESAVAEVPLAVERSADD